MTTTTEITIALPGAICAVCGVSCAGEAVETAPGPNGATWWLHCQPPNPKGIGLVSQPEGRTP